MIKIQRQEEKMMAANKEINFLIIIQTSKYEADQYSQLYCYPVIVGKCQKQGQIVVPSALKRIFCIKARE